MKTVNIIGCGRAGRALARVWTRRRVLQVQGILNRTLESSRQAAAFVGAGSAVDGYAALPPADLVLIATADEAIPRACRELCQAGRIAPATVVFHLSGSLPASLLQPAQEHGAGVASVHPVKSFADPALAADTFPGTYCALEGDPAACQLLEDVFQRSGALPFPVDPRAKPVYHAGTVFLSNYLVALIELGLRCFQQAGVSREKAMAVLMPMVRGTAENTAQLGPVQALTGPIARGEPSVVRRHMEALGDWDEPIRRIYQDLGRVALALARQQGGASPDALAAIGEILER